MFSKIIAAVLCWGLLIPSGIVSAQSKPPAETKEATKKTTSAPAPKEPQPLNSEEEQSLTERSQEPGREVAGGALSNEHLTYIVIALAAIVLVLVLK